MSGGPLKCVVLYIDRGGPGAPCRGHEADCASSQATVDAEPGQSLCRGKRVPAPCTTLVRCRFRCPHICARPLPLRSVVMMVATWDVHLLR